VALPYEVYMRKEKKLQKPVGEYCYTYAGKPVEACEGVCEPVR